MMQWVAKDYLQGMENFTADMGGEILRNWYRSVMINLSKMQLVPLMRCRNMRRSLDFYTNVLDFAIKYPDSTADDDFVTIINDQAEIELSVSDGTTGTILNIQVEDVDALFEKYVSRGLDTSGKKQSPVHQGPLDQTWGMREFYVTDSDGHTLRFVKC